ncbi:MAG TPA: glycosyltransferase family 4 protein [Candidatus Saccharimonadales bacterium]
MLGWELPPHNSGGLGVACYEMCRALVKDGATIQFIVPYTAQHDIDFMTVTAASPQDAVEVMLAGGAYDSAWFIQSTRDGQVVGHSLYEQQTIYEQSVDRLVDINEFDIIHAHDWLTFRAAIKLKRRCHKPLIVHIHATEYDRSGGRQGNNLVREIEYQGMMMADKVIAVSQATKRVLVEEYAIPATKVEVVHNSINLSDWPPDHSLNVYSYIELLKQHGYKVIVNVGRLVIQKGLTHLLQAAQRVLEYQPKTLFLIVGSGDQYQELIELGAELGISQNLLFTGFQRGKAVDDAYRVADLFVMPSVSEPFGITPLEAGARGVPSLISKQSGVSEVMGHALRVDYWDEQEMANQIVSVLRSDALRQTMADLTAAELSGRSWRDAADRLQTVYKSELTSQR